MLQSMNFVADDWIEKDSPTGSICADNNPPSLPSDCPKVSFLFELSVNTILKISLSNFVLPLLIGFCMGFE